MKFVLSNISYALSNAAPLCMSMSDEFINASDPGDVIATVLGKLIPSVVVLYKRNITNYSSLVQSEMDVDVIT
jgi:hypothetical protein